MNNQAVEVACSGSTSVAGSRAGLRFDFSCHPLSCATGDRLTVTAMDFDAVRRMLPPMSDDEFGAWLRRHVLDGIHDDIAADMQPAHHAAIEVVRNSDRRLDNMLRALRDATQVNTLDLQVLVAHLDKGMDKLGILVPGTRGRDDDAATELWLAENGDALATSNA